MLLGKKTSYPQQYDKSVLYPVKRDDKRKDINYTKDIQGIDIWTCYETSCLDYNGKPCSFIGILSYTSNSEFIIESKSLKLYLNSFNMTKTSKEEFEDFVRKDLSECLNCEVNFFLYDLKHFNNKFPVVNLTSKNIDDIECAISKYTVSSDILNLDNMKNTLFIHSNLLRSNCLVTGQPDWGTIEIFIDGEVPTEESLLKYIISFRNHQEFHEQCIERIISTLIDKFKIDRCFVKGNYVRRGGIDINPFRCYNVDINNFKKLNRLVRQ